MEALTSATVLTHYDTQLPLILAADASAWIGAVISHVLPDGVEGPIAYASRTITQSKKNYSQLEKEALSLIFAVRKFHQYLYGRQFTLYLIGLLTLLSYQTTPHASTMVKPAELFLNQHLRTRLDLLYPRVEYAVSSSQTKQKQSLMTCMLVLEISTLVREC